jgi:hypothetical protein
MQDPALEGTTPVMTPAAVSAVMIPEVVSGRHHSDICHLKMEFYAQTLMVI